MDTLSTPANAPIFDILLATYNGEAFLSQMIESIQAQDLASWRLLISDDGSSDATVAIASRLASNDPRIVLVETGRHHRGVVGNFFSLLPRSTASYVAFCDQDDVWLPNKLSTLAATLGDPEVATLAFSDLRVVDQDLATIADSFMRYGSFVPSRTELRNLLPANIAPGCSMAFTRALLERARMPRQLEDVCMHDWWLMLLAAALGTVSYVAQPLALYRQHARNAAGAPRFSISDFRSGLARKALVRRAVGTRRSQLQARLFADTMRGALDARAQELCDAYGSLASSGPLAALGTLAHHGLWMGNVRARLGQVLLCFFFRSSARNVLGR